MNKLGYRPSPYVINNYAIDDKSGCWIWQGAKDTRGYGRVSVSKSKKMLAHRVFYEYFKGSIPDGMLALHSCDNPPCVNPDHLEAGTHKKNAQDMVSRGRATNHGGRRRGSGNPCAKLTEEQVREIKILMRGGRSHRDIAGRYGVSKAAIGMISIARTWSHIDG